MTAFRNWLQSKSARLLVLLAAVQIYLIVGQIIPAYEKIPYFETKNRMLKQQQAKLKLNREHAIYYRAKHGQSVNETPALGKTNTPTPNANEIMKTLNQLHFASGLEMVNQAIEQSPLNGDFSRISIDQTLRGKYRDLARYLEKVTLLQEFVVVTRCEFHSNSFLAYDPTLNLNVVITLYLPLNP